VVGLYSLEIVKRIPLNCIILEQADGSKHDSMNFYENSFDEFNIDKSKISNLVGKKDTMKSNHLFKK